MQFYDLALTSLSLHDQHQLRQMLNVAAIRAYLCSKPGIHENFIYNHHNMEYEWGHSGSQRIANLYTHTQPPLLRLRTTPESTATLGLEQSSLPTWKEIQIDEFMDAATVLQQIDQAYTNFMSQFNHDTTLIPLLDRSLPTLETLRRLCALHQIKNPEPILALVQPAIRILTRRAEEQTVNHISERIGHSHFGGRPDLPKDFDWPRYKDRPMAFLGQINVVDIDLILGRSDLPDHGILYFFSAFAWGEDYSDGLDYDDPANTHVVYYDGSTEHLWPQNCPPGMPPIGKWGWGLYPYTTLHFVSQLSLPSPDEMPDLPEGVSRELYEEIYYEFTFLSNDYFRHAPQHQLLGHAWPIQGFSMSDEERLLLQVATDYWETDFQWGDGGMLYFSMPKSDLQKRDFSHCRCNYESG